MKPEEAIEGLNHELLILECFIEEENSFICDCDVDDDEYDDEKEQCEISLTRYKKEKEVIEMAISALKEIQLYKDNKLCLVPEDVYSRQCSELDAYKEIGTVDECREAVEKQKAKKCIIDSCSDHAHYKCPSCGQIELSIYKHGFPRLGRITKYCENCGQALIDENLEGME